MGRVRTSFRPPWLFGFEPMSADDLAGGRPFFFGTNLKMYQTPAETCALLDGLASVFPRACVQGFVLPSFTSLSDAVRHPVREHIWLGAQTAHWADEGPHTGEISPRMLAALGLDLVMAGHAERRLAGESDEMVNRKVLATLRHGLRVLICIGETAIERSAGIGAESCTRQLMLALRDVPADAAARLLVAYEPVWAIGVGGTPATLAQAEPVAATLKQALQRALQTAVIPPLLYGGSVDATNAADFAGGSTFDGLFVGRAAWTPSGFATVLEAAEQARFANGPGTGET
jgi:triosephosphate isomerase